MNFLDERWRTGRRALKRAEVPHEDLMKLSYADASFDITTTADTRRMCPTSTPR